jgi:hypothetical protein
MEHRGIRNDSLKIVMAALFFAFILGGLNSCFFDNEEQLYPVENCGNINVSYRLDVVPILESACYDCHDFSNAPVLGDGINLEGRTKLKEYIEANSNRFLGSLKWNGQGSEMPKNSSKLDLCTINKIEVWINEGMLNN